MAVFISTFTFLERALATCFTFFVVRNGAVQYRLNVKWCPLIKLGHSVPRWFLSFCPCY